MISGSKLELYINAMLSVAVGMPVTRHPQGRRGYQDWRPTPTESAKEWRTSAARRSRLSGEMGESGLHMEDIALVTITEISISKLKPLPRNIALLVSAAQHSMLISFSKSINLF